MKIWLPGLLTLVLAGSALAAWPQATAVFNRNGRIPLGIESLRARPAGGTFYVVASAENPEFASMYRAKDRNGHDALFDANRTQVKFYPRHVEFRVTASSREKLVREPPFEVRENIKLDQLFTHISFRLKVFHGLDARYIEPGDVEEIGVPKSIAYNERIYRVGFDLGNLPITDRVVMEVLTPNGDRLCKFHLDLY